MFNFNNVIIGFGKGFFACSLNNYQLHYFDDVLKVFDPTINASAIEFLLYKQTGQLYRIVFDTTTFNI